MALHAPSAIADTSPAIPTRFRFAMTSLRNFYDSGIIASFDTIGNINIVSQAPNLVSSRSSPIMGIRPDFIEANWRISH
jgi:hypothetical protein